MFRKPMLILLAAGLAATAVTFAQEAEENTADQSKTTTDTTGPGRFWQATVPGGSLMVALDRITSVSRAKYVLDGAVIVDEVTIDTTGQALTRFYFITPVTDAAPGNTASQVSQRARELLNKASDRLSTDLPNMVQKTYPGTTHAKSIEYRFANEADLTALYNSVKNAWESGRGRVFTAK